jgi:DNA-binding NarL/FixJ family response regulator
MKVVICDDQAIIRDGLELLLKLEKDIDVAGLAQDGAEAVDLAAKLSPDLILIDLKMPGMNGVEATRRICAQYPGIKVLVLTTFDDDEWVFDAIRAGACGYLLKDTPREKVIEAIRGTMLGKSYIDPSVAGKLLGQVASQQEGPPTLITENLTSREVEVLRLIAHGFSNADIADRLHLSEGTVRNHVSAIFSKLKVSDRTQAAIIAIRHGLDKL